MAHVGNDADGDGREDWEVQRDDHKARGDGAFRVGAYKTAIGEYTNALSLDPDHVVLHSNRSAAYLANGEPSRALHDAERCVALDASFVRGHSRLAAALFALKRHGAAVEAYRRVLDVDGANAAAKRGLEACEGELRRISELRRKQEEEEEDGFLRGAAASGVLPTPAASGGGGKSESPAVAKDGDENGGGGGGGGGGDDDDLLDDFFDEVEEAVTKTKGVGGGPGAASATNAIRNDRAALGTAREQIDRLLQPRHEWRNLNPYFVLQLPAATATDEEISRRYKALSLLLHPDKNRSVAAGGACADAKDAAEREEARVQLAYDQVQKAKVALTDPDRKRHAQALVAEGMKQGEWRWAQEQKALKKKTDKSKKKDGGGDGGDDDADRSLDALQDREVMRIFAQVEQKRREVEERERSHEQRERQQEDEALEKARRERQFDKKWRDEDRVGKRVGNWRDFSGSSGPSSGNNGGAHKKARP